MKYILIFFIALYKMSSVVCYAQNTFPATGNVGIGTVNPASLLTVGSASMRGTLDVKGSTTDLPALSISDLRNGGKQFTFYNGLSATGNLDIFDQVAQAFRLTIASGGNIGIGTAYPDALLHVKSNSVIFGSNGGSFTQHIHQGGVGGKYHLALDGLTKLTIDNDGKMGIGPTAPTDKLHIYTGPSAAYGTSGGITISDSYTVGRFWDSGGGLDIGTLDLYNNGSQMVRMIANGDSYINGGRVGIGTTTPSSMLHLYNVNSTANVNIQSTASHSLLNLHPASSNNYSYINLGDGASFGWQIGKDIDAGGIAGANGFYVYELTEGNHATRLAINKGGKVGIGKTNPATSLDVNGSVQSSGQFILDNNSGNDIINKSATGNLRLGWGTYGIPEGAVFGTDGNQPLIFATAYAEKMRLSASGNLGIGTSLPSEKLSVNGNVRAKKVIVSQSSWPDYVFDSSYKLRPLSEVEQFIHINKRLPEMLSAKEVEEKGVSVGDNQALLLKKIEELTLYLIELRKENIEIKKQMQVQASEIKELKKEK